MDFLNQVKTQLGKMSETEKDAWILSQAKLLSENRREGFLLSLSGEKKIIDMPTQEEINQFCEKAENGEIFFEYMARYYEFDDDGGYMDDWRKWHKDVFGVIPFLDKVFRGCHDLLVLEEYQAVSDILGRVCELRFPVEEAEDSEDTPEEEELSLSDADEEGLLSRRLSDVGADWIIAVVKLTEGQDEERRAQKLIEMFEHPACRKVKPRILVEEGVSQEIFSDMAAILEGRIAELEAVLKENPGKGTDFHARYKVQMALDRREEILLDIRVKCMKAIAGFRQQNNSNLAACWEQVKEGIRWLGYEKHINDQLEIDEIQNICKAIIRTGQLEQEDWKIRKQVLEDIIQNRFYDDLTSQM